MRPLVTLPLAICAGLALGAPAVAATSTEPAPLRPRDAAAAATLARQQAALDLLNQATSDVRKARKTCRPTFTGLDAKPPLAGAPDPAIVAALAPLRRPATSEELTALGTGPEAIGAHGPGAIYTSYVRVATAANGRRLLIVIARQTPPDLERPASCLTAETARLEALLVGQPKDVSSLAHHYLRQSHRGERRQRRQAPFDGVFTYSIGPNGRGSGGGGGDARRFLRYGNFGGSSRAGGSEVNGLVPDGVARIRFDYPKRQSFGPLYEPVVHARAIHRTVRVHDNVVDFRIARGVDGSLPSRMTWLAADGHVLRVVRH